MYTKISLVISTLLLVTGCGIYTSKPLENTSQNPAFTLSQGTLTSPSSHLITLPSFTQGWSWEERPTSTTALRQLKAEYNKFSPNYLSSSMSTSSSPPHGLFLNYSTTSIISSNNMGSGLSFFLYSTHSNLPWYSNYYNISQITIFADATTTTSSGCTELFTKEYPFVLSSSQFEETVAVTINGVRFEHATETLHSKYAPVTQDFYRGSAHGICYRIMKIIDRGGIQPYRGKEIEREFNDILNSLTFF